MDVADVDVVAVTVDGGRGAGHHVWSPYLELEFGDSVGVTFGEALPADAADTVPCGPGDFGCGVHVVALLSVADDSTVYD